MNRLERERNQITKNFDKKIDKRAMGVWDENDRTLLSSTRLFMATAQHPDLQDSEWMVSLSSSASSPLALRVLNHVISDSSTNLYPESEQETSQ